MKKALLITLVLATALVASAANYSSKNQSVSASAVADTSDAMDFRGYSQLAIQTIFATCTGTTNNCSLWVQTSNNNIDWKDILLVAAAADAQDHSGDKYFDYIPNQTAETSTIPTGFGRYIRMRLAVSGTASVSYSVYFEAKE